MHGCKRARLGPFVRTSEIGDPGFDLGGCEQCQVKHGAENLQKPPMSVPSVEGFARWNFERKADLAGAISANAAAQGRPLRLFSMYTGWGTAEMVANSVGRVFNALKGSNALQVEVAWMCESNLDKCRYLAEAFKEVQHIFTDATEVASGCAWEYRTGRRLLVPMDLDGGFVGYPCVDLSSLNTGPGQFKDASTATGKGYANMLKVVDKCDRLSFLGVENSGNMWHKRKEDQFERPIDIQDAAFRERGFLASSHRVSAHEFGPPQSRTRSWSLYMRKACSRADGLEGEVALSNLFLSFRCEALSLPKLLAEIPGFRKAPAPSEKVGKSAKWMQQFAEIAKRLGQEQLDLKVQEVLSMDLPLTSREVHVVAIAVHELQARGVDLRKEPVVIQVDQGFGRSWHRSDHRIAPCIIPKGKYLLTGPTWRLMDKQEKCFLQGVGPQEIRAYRMEELLSENQLNDMAGNAFTAQICMAAYLSFLVCWNSGARPGMEAKQEPVGFRV
ncbi:unnamed protein product [Symbiodinium natans]|uniref:Uncharacterized protein n=1 Tax=Symbiodinium natans TaxID=878477 RepID=A0A812M1P9_9DINO|nr:unnamed protein product [Symbiodinium natans]